MRNLNTSYPSYRSRRSYKRRSYRPLILILICFLILIIFGRSNTQTLLTSSASSLKPSPSPKQDPGLATVIQPLIPTDNGDFAIVVRDLSGSQHNYFFQSSRAFPAASLYKLFLISAAYRQMDSGRIDPRTTLQADVGYLSDRLGGTEFGYEDVTDVVSYSVGDCLDRIARLSDNFCAVMLADKVGWDTVQSEASLLGASHTIIKDPITTTPDDVALYLNKLFNHQVVDATASAKIVDLLTSNYSHDRIPSLLPDGLKIAHKTGELSRVRHDAGIVYLDRHPYLIVMMSENLSGEDTAVDSMANISKAVYDYFAKLPDS